MTRLSIAVLCVAAGSIISADVAEAQTYRYRYTYRSTTSYSVNYGAAAVAGVAVAGAAIGVIGSLLEAVPSPGPSPSYDAPEPGYGPSPANVGETAEQMGRGVLDIMTAVGGRGDPNDPRSPEYRVPHQPRQTANFRRSANCSDITGTGGAAAGPCRRGVTNARMAQRASTNFQNAHRTASAAAARDDRAGLRRAQIAFSRAAQEYNQAGDTENARRAMENAHMIERVLSDRPNVVATAADLPAASPVSAAPGANSGVPSCAQTRRERDAMRAAGRVPQWCRSASQCQAMAVRLKPRSPTGVDWVNWHLTRSRCPALNQAQYAAVPAPGRGS